MEKVQDIVLFLFIILQHVVYRQETNFSHVAQPRTYYNAVKDQNSLTIVGHWITLSQR